MRVVRIAEPVSDFHARTVAADLVAAEAWRYAPPGPALVLGSAQDLSTVDLAAAEATGVEVVCRRSGGGAVWVPASGSLWLDVVVPRQDHRWSDDVRASAYWLGEAWLHALTSLGLDARLHQGGLEKTEWGRLVCFGSMGPGEVTIEGRKAVGISQRRTREGARFQCIVYAEWDPDAVLELLRLEPLERRRARADLGDVATGVGDRLAELEVAVLRELSMS